MIKTLVRRIIRFCGYDIIQYQNPLNNDLKLYHQLFKDNVLEQKPFFNVGAGAFHHPYWTNIDKSSECIA